MGRGKQMKALAAMLAEKEDELRRLQIEIATLKDAIARASGNEPRQKKRAPRSDVKRRVLDMLAEVRHSGLNAGMAVQMARDTYDVELDRGTVSSLLSRLKNEGVVTYDGKVYRLKEFRGEGDNTENVNVIYPLRTSSDSR